MSPATVTTASGAPWQAVAEDRQKYRDSTIAALSPPLPEITEKPLNTIPIAKQVLTADEIKITESLVEDLVVKLANAELSATEVVKAFLRRAGLAQKLTNCITELLPEKALTRAAYLDEYLKSNGKPVGPLHGIPISVKEHIGMKGLDHNAGFVAWVGNTCEEDSLILQILWDAGAVFYVRTTQPQSLMHLETSSNIYGVTSNPFNTTLTPGGSSGGEGALVGFRGSCLGIGTDIGGSIRSPAANNGLYGIKPTSGRLPMTGLIAAMGGQDHIYPTIGPLSTSLEGCKLFIKTLIDAKPWLREPSLLPFQWREEQIVAGKEGKLKVAVLWDDGVVKVHPPVTRALEKVVGKLKGMSDVEVVEWTPYKHAEAWEIIASLYFADGATDVRSNLSASGEPALPLTTHVIANPHVVTHTIPSLWAANNRRDAYRAEYAAHWNATGVDVILCPVGPGVAPKQGTSKWWGYTSQWNLLDYPAVVFPVDEVKGGETVAQKHEGRNERDKENWALWEQYGEEGYKGAPVSLQVVGRRFELEKVVGAVEKIVEGGF